MRITPTQIQTIQQQIHQYLGASAVVWLFGSRLDDMQKGGDVDLYVEAGPHRLMDELRCKVGLQEYLDTPVDLIVRKSSDMSSIATIAKKQGVRL
jgi:predicted nucleotidyltransferase